jgi:hypothetical protein
MLLMVHTISLTLGSTIGIHMSTDSTGGAREPGVSTRLGTQSLSSELRRTIDSMITSMVRIEELRLL